MQGRESLPVVRAPRLKVLAFTHGITLPPPSVFLAALGADVVTIRFVREDGPDAWTSPDGYYPGSLMDGNGVRPRTVGLDVNSPAGHDIACRLAAVTDILVDGAGAGELDRLGLGHQVLLVRNPRLVYCSVPEGGVRGSSGHGIGIEPRGWHEGQGPHTDEAILDWLRCRETDVERFRLEGAFG